MPVQRVMEQNKAMVDHLVIPAALEQLAGQEDLGGAFSGILGLCISRYAGIQRQGPQWDECFHKG